MPGLWGWLFMWFPRMTLPVLLSLSLVSSVARATVVVRRSAPTLVQEGSSLTVPFLIANNGTKPATAALQVQGIGVDVQAPQESVTIAPSAWYLAKVRAALKPGVDSGSVTCAFGSVAASVAVVRGVDLANRAWEWIPGSQGNTPDAAWLSDAAPGLIWLPLRPPVLWQNLGYSPCRVRFTIPSDWKGKPLHLVMGAVDDNDRTYLNGHEIGRTNGWDTPRNYALPGRYIRWGDVNTLVVIVENVNAGGGLYKPPFAIVCGSTWPSPLSAVQAAPRDRLPRRPAPGIIGKPLPLRPIHVENGVLRYPDGKEVALWGTNYYPQSWNQYVHLKRLGVDIKKAIRRDLADMKQMGVQAIRIHVFDREISDGHGNLIRNEHLDLLDYLVAECNRQSLYLMLTPIAWWGSPCAIPGSFSDRTSKPGMMFVPEALDAEERYLTQFLRHTNPYTRRALVHEPCLCALEIQNEPAYFTYGDMFADVYTPQGEAPEVVSHDKRVLRDLWAAWLRENDLTESEPNYHIFRYVLMRRYIARMESAIRSTGARQPIAVSSFGANDADIAEAIGDSSCDAITLSTYPGGWAQVNDGTNLLPTLPTMSLNAAYADKARIAYEFDAPATNTSCYLYPAIAAWLRSGEVQLACQFQYDSFYDARWNVDWAPHWLNLWYTPGKAVSFRAAGAGFASLPRGVSYKSPGDHLVVGPLATSFAHNTSIYADADLVCHSRQLHGWIPLKLPSAPIEVMGVGSSPYAEYSGTGSYTLRRRSRNIMDLTIRPDVELVGNSLAGSFQCPVANLLYHKQWFRLLVPGWQHATYYRWTNSRWRALPRCGTGVLLEPGVYCIVRDGVLPGGPPPR